jgi:uncharacterized membrane protein YozB (DUF420 family)
MKRKQKLVIELAEGRNKKVELPADVFLVVVVFVIKNERRRPKKNRALLMLFFLTGFFVFFIILEKNISMGTAQDFLGRVLLYFFYFFFCLCV